MKEPKVHRVAAPRAKQYSHHGSHHVAAAFYDTRGRWRSTLTLNNKGPQEKRPRITLVSHDGQKATLPNISVPATGFVDIDLNAAAAAAGPGFEFGSLRMTYYGDTFEMGAQVLVADLRRSIQFDEQLSYASTSASSTRQAVWWLPTREASLTLVLTNLSDEPIVVRGQLRGTADTPLDTVRLEPQSLRVIPVPRAERPGMPSTGGLSLTYDGPSGALLARGFVEAGRAGYSAPVEFADPAAFLTSSLHGGGLRLSGPDGSPVSPVVVATNAGPVSTRVMGAFVTTSPDGEVLRFPLPPLSLSPGETAPLDSALAEAGARAAAAGVPAGLEIDYTTSPGSVLATAASVSPDLNHVFRVPLIDPETPKSSTGGYPWRADGQTATVVYLKNTTTQPQNYVLQLSFPGGVYAPGLKTLKPGETFTLDIKALRDAQVPDAFGQAIPREAGGGQVHWSAKGRTRHAIIGRAEHVDHDHGVSASYACINCCPDNPDQWWMDGDPIVVPIGDWVDVYVYLQDRDCYNNPLAPYSLGGWHGQNWWISNTNVAVGNNNATVTGVAAGSTTLHFNYSSEYWYPDVYEYGWFCNYNPFPVIFETPVQVGADCGDERTYMIEEYRAGQVAWTPRCEDFANSGGSTHFSWSELNGGFTNGNPHNPWGIVRSGLTSGLQSTRSNYNRGGIRLSSGYRCPHGNANVGGVQQSLHMHGRAADMYSNDHPWTEAEFELLREAARLTNPAELLNWDSYPDRHLHAAW